MVRGRDDGDEDSARVSHAEDEIEEFPEGVFAGFEFLEARAEEAGVVDEGTADGEGVAEVHAGVENKYELLEVGRGKELLTWAWPQGS